MGGNALKANTTRLSKSDFEAISTHCVANLKARFPGQRVAVIPAYRAKPDFGDCDILISSTGYDPNVAADALSATEVVRNGPVTSVGVQVGNSTADPVFQVDLIAIADDSFDYALGYFSFNDLGNLIGRTAHKAGLAHKHDGLCYYVRDDDNKLREIYLTRNHDIALEFLGYEPQRFHQGFETLVDIFKYVAGSRYFNSDIFLLENRNATSRIRDRKRFTYTEFLKWCEARPNLPRFDYPEHKEAWLPRINEHFPQFGQAYEQAMADLARQKAAKARFNGEYVAQLTGLEGKALGALMARFKDSFTSMDERLDFVLSCSPEELATRVLAARDTLSQGATPGQNPLTGV